MKQGKKASKKCAYCCSKLEVVYYLKAGMYFCNDDCVEEFDWDKVDVYSVAYEPYEDEYELLHYTFCRLYPEGTGYRKLTKSKKDELDPLKHIKLLTHIRELEEVIYNDEYESLQADEDSDGPIAAEIYRILEILKEELKDLISIEIKLHKKRGEQKEIKGDKVECSNCHSISERKFTRRAIDNFRYCEDCYDSVQFAGGFNFDYLYGYTYGDSFYLDEAEEV